MQLMASGVMLMVHTEWGLRECHAMRHGVGTLIKALDEAPTGTPLAEADRWLLTHMLLHVSLDLTHVTGILLPTHLTMVNRRWPREIGRAHV